MAIRLGDEAPDFTAQTTQGEVKFHEWLGDSWGVLFSHPKDYTPVCTTELGYTAKLKPEFDKRGVKVIGLSVDALESPPVSLSHTPDSTLGQVGAGYERISEKFCEFLGESPRCVRSLGFVVPDRLAGLNLTVVLALGDDLPGVWTAPSTTDKDRKRLLRSLLDEVNINVHRDQDRAHAELLLRWKGGAITDLSVPIKRTPPNRLRTDEDTIDLVRRLAAHYPDATIAHILNRQNRRTAHGLSFTAGRVQSLRHH